LEVEKQTKQVSETAKRAAMGPEDRYVGYVDLSLTREGWIKSKRRWSNFGAGQGRLGTRKRNQSNDLD
jgi:hypothetical protein